MSTIRANTIQDASGGSNAQLFGVASPPNSMGFRNRIINGAMVIDQRNAGASVTPAGGVYTLDRWEAVLTQASKFSVQQNAGSVARPAGFTNYLGTTSTSAYSVLAGDFFAIRQKIEGFNVADLGWGAAGAQTVTLSFWVRSSLTGTFGGSLYNADGSRSYPFSYTISAANTWELETVTITGDTTGTWGTGNGAGIQVGFSLGAGSTFSGTAGSWSGSFFISATGATSVVGTNGATFYITGVQLEAGTVASPFERRDYGTELVRCQRYYEVLVVSGSNILLFPGSIDFARNSYPFKITKRATPTVAGGSGSAEGGGSWTPNYQVSGVETWSISAFYGSSLIRPVLNGPVTASIEL